MLYSEQIPENLGIIFRREYVDLRDSTIQDFQKYTGIVVNSQREVELPNKSKILFRHIEELNNIQNINLGWFAIEQADELDSDKEFFMLFGRLRRKCEPSEYFKSLGLPERSGFVIGNAGEHWGKPLWKDGTLEDSECIEATTYDNADVLPKDYLDSLEILKVKKPEIYQRYVMNDWNVSGNQWTLITIQNLELLKGLELFPEKIRKITSTDPSTGGDECVIYQIENNEAIDAKYMHENNTMIIAGEIQVMANKYKCDNYCSDSIGIGKGIVDRLDEIFKDDPQKKVMAVNSAESAQDKDRFNNKRAEMWWYVFEKIQNKEIPYPEDEELRKQLSSVRYKVVNSNGKIQLELKTETKKRLGRSPDRADAFVYGVYHQQFVEPEIKKEKIERYHLGEEIKEKTEKEGMSLVNF